MKLPGVERGSRIARGKACGVLSLRQLFILFACRMVLKDPGVGSIPIWSSQHAIGDSRLQCPSRSKVEDDVTLWELALGPIHPCEIASQRSATDFHRSHGVPNRATLQSAPKRVGYMSRPRSTFPCLPCYMVGRKGANTRNQWQTLRRASALDPVALTVDLQVPMPTVWGLRKGVIGFLTVTAVTSYQLVHLPDHGWMDVTLASQGARLRRKEALVPFLLHGLFFWDLFPHFDCSGGAVIDDGCGLSAAITASLAEGSFPPHMLDFLQAAGTMFLADVLTVPCGRQLGGACGGVGGL